MMLIIRQTIGKILLTCIILPLYICKDIKNYFNKDSINKKPNGKQTF